MSLATELTLESLKGMLDNHEDMSPNEWLYGSMLIHKWGDALEPYTYVETVLTNTIEDFEHTPKFFVDLHYDWSSDTHTPEYLELLTNLWDNLIWWIFLGHEDETVLIKTFN